MVEMLVACWGDLKVDSWADQKVFLWVAVSVVLKALKKAEMMVDELAAVMVFDWVFLGVALRAGRWAGRKVLMRDGESVGQLVEMSADYSADLKALVPVACWVEWMDSVMVVP